MLNYYYKKAALRKFFFCLDKLLFFKLKKNPYQVKRVLVVNLGGLGDVLLMEPLIRQITKLWPLASIDILVDTLAQDILDNHPNIHSIETFALPWLSHSRPSWMTSLKLFLLQIKLLKAKSYDLVFDIKGDPLIILLLTLAGIKYRIGFINGGLGALLHEGYDFFSYKLPRAQLNYLLLSSFWQNWQLEEARPVLTLTETELAWAPAEKVRLCNPNKKTIAIHLGGGRPEKIWSSHYWGHLLDDLSAYNLLVIGSKSDYNLFASLNNVELINGLGYELRQSAALISQADLFIGGDSGPGHIAAALGVPVISIFSLVNDPQTWAANKAKLITYASNYTSEQLDTKALELKTAILAALN